MIRASGLIDLREVSSLISTEVTEREIARRSRKTMNVTIFVFKGIAGAEKN